MLLPRAVTVLQVNRDSTSNLELQRMFVRYWWYYCLLVARLDKYMVPTTDGPEAKDVVFHRVRNTFCPSRGHKAVRRLPPRHRMRMRLNWWLLPCGFGWWRPRLVHASMPAAVCALVLNLMMLLWLEVDSTVRSRGAGLNSSLDWGHTAMFIVSIVYLVSMVHAMAAEWAVWGGIRVAVRWSPAV